MATFTASGQVPPPAAFVPERWRSLDDGHSPIETTLFSMPSLFFDAPECLDLLRAIRRHRPKRKLLVLTDYAGLKNEAAARFRDGARELGIGFIDTHGRNFSPWLRDPILIMTDRQNELMLLSRPNLQKGREEDRFMARQFVQGVPASQPLSWASAPFVFHGGHLVFTPEATWISIHTLQNRLLEVLGRKTIYVPRLREPSQWKRFVRAAEKARKELAQLCGRPVRFVHPWPGETGAAPSFLDALFGGNDFDLDTLLTILPTGERPVVLVSDLDLGAALLAAVEDDELAVFARQFHIAQEAPALRDKLLNYQRIPRVRRLAEFLELVASHVQAEGCRVLRTPLVLVPSSLIANDAISDRDYPPPHFPLGFSNVVLETTELGERTAEGFSSCLPNFDRKAGEVFAEAGYRLALHPALVPSIIFEGGYRCATQEIRRPTPRNGAPVKTGRGKR